MFKLIRNFIQRGRRGYSDSDVWHISSHLCKMMPIALRNLKKGVGCPSDFYDANETNNECHLWNDTLEAMAQGFEAAEFLENMRYHKWVSKNDDKFKGRVLELDYQSMENAKKKMEVGLKLFAENFINLWD